MHEVQVTVVGRVATPVDFRRTGAGEPAVRFRLASTARRFDRERQAWTDASTSFYTVLAWRGLAANVASSVSVGEPVVVRGQLRVREGEREGRRFVSVELLASAIGHDLSRGTSAFARTRAAGPGPGGASVTARAPAPVPGQAPGGGTDTAIHTATAATAGDPDTGPGPRPVSGTRPADGF